MAERRGKRAVIISNIKSDSIEQAIFILRSTSAEPTAAAVGRGIVEEAQEIINNYINTVEIPEAAERCGRNRRIAAVLAVLAFILSAAAAAVCLLLD